MTHPSHLRPANGAPYASAPANRKGGPVQRHGIRVLCVDDHTVLIEGLRAQFAVDGGLHVVGHLTSAERLVEETQRCTPDVVLLDIEMPGPDIFEMADRMRQVRPSQRFAFLSAHVRDGYLTASYKCGAWGYFSKGDDLRDIVDGIKRVATSTAGTFVMSPKVLQRCGVAEAATPGALPCDRRPNAPSATRPATGLATLTSREIEVLRLIGKGRSRGEIAAELSRSVKTIDGHQERVLRKLGLETRAELMRFALREGLAEV